MSAVIETSEIRQESSTALAVAKDFKVTSQDEYITSADRLKAIKALARKIDETFDPHIKRAFDSHRALCAEKKQHMQPLEDAERLIKKAVIGYQLDQERIRREAEARAQEEARKERERLEAQSRKLEAKGKAEQAAAKQAAADAVIAPTIAPSVPKVAGLSTRVTFKAVVLDKLELVKAVAAGIVPLNALDANMPFLNNQARAMRQTMAYPGVRVEEETGLASRSA
jgi:hypothetical protein